jgi:hypothetical protein
VCADDDGVAFPKPMILDPLPLIAQLLIDSRVVFLILIDPKGK